MKCITYSSIFKSLEFKILLKVTLSDLILKICLYLNIICSYLNTK